VIRKNTLKSENLTLQQQLQISYSKSGGNLSIAAATDIFPSATLKLNGAKIMQYN
jgi:hypothetical protein